MDVLDEPAVAHGLHYQALIPAIARALAALSSGKVVQPVRTVLPVAPHQGFFAVMPAYAGALGAKLVTFYPKNVGVHTHHALIVMFKAETGEPLAMMDGRLITEMRTAAASAVGARGAPPPGAAGGRLFGSGGPGEKDPPPPRPPPPFPGESGLGPRKTTGVRPGAGGGG